MSFTRLTIATAAIATAALGGVVVPAGAGTAAPVAPTASYHVTLSISATSATAREDKIALTGTVTPKPPEDSVVKVQVKYENQNIWKKAGTATIKNNGKYRFLVEPESHLDRVYRVVKAADDKATADKSPVRSLDVIGWSWLTKLTPSATENMSFAPNMPINGEDYSHTLYVNRAWDAGYTEFTLGRKCLTLETTLGLSDRTETGGKAAIYVSWDGGLVYSRLFDLGQSEFVRFDVSDVYRIRLDFDQAAETPDTEPSAGAARVLCD